MLNIEIVKFYKAIIRSKDTHYITLIVMNKLFYPINRIFEATYDAKNPPMIQSCIRDLYEMIFSSSGKSYGNEFYSLKLEEFLTCQD